MLLLIGIVVGIVLMALLCRWGMRVAMRSAFRGMLIWAFLALCVCLIPGSRPAQASSLKATFASIPDLLFHVVTFGTDKAQYVADKAAYGFDEVDYYADEAVDYFHNLAHPPSAIAAAKLARKQAKAAKKAAKAQKKAGHIEPAPEPPAVVYTPYVASSYSSPLPDCGEGKHIAVHGDSATALVVACE